MLNLCVQNMLNLCLQNMLNLCVQNRYKNVYNIGMKM